MNNGKLKIGASVVVVALLAAGALWLLQQAEIKRLVAENAGLRTQLSQMASLQDNNGQLGEQLKAAVEMSQANQNELMRLRSQASRLRQLEHENTQLRAQGQKLDRQMREAQLAAAPSSEQGQVTALSEVVKATGERPHRDTTDLGSLELTDGIAEARFDLGGGTNCLVTPTALSDGNATMEITLGATNADGTVSELGTSRLTARPGQHCSISVGDRMIALAVKLK